MNFETARYHMIEQQLRTCELLSPEQVEQLYADRREAYVPDAYRALAFADTAIPLGQGVEMLTPKLEARLLLAAKLKGDERVLEIGTGSGHMAALLAERAAQVWSVEIDPVLAERARANLQNEAIDTVIVEVGDGLSGLAAQAPFDRIVLSGGVTEVPAALLAQLKIGGCLLAFVGTAPVMNLCRITRHAEGVDGLETLLETAVPMLRQPASPRFVF